MTKECDSLLVVENVHFWRRIPTGRAAEIGPLSFHLRAGEFLSLLGPSGAGKTTLLEIIAGIQRRYEGSVRLDGEAIERPSRRVQLVFQDDRLLPWKTVRENLEFAARPADPLGKAAIESLLEFGGLTDRARSWPETLSGGERGRVSLIRALIDPPEVLLLDEPFRNLDLTAKWLLQDMLAAFLAEKGIAALMVSHSVRDAIFFSDRILLLASRPMRIVEELDVCLKEPRDQENLDLVKLAGEIVRRLKAAEREQVS